MRPSLLAVPVVVLALAVPAGWAAARSAGTLSVENGIGTVTVKGTGTVVGRMERGEIVISDLSPVDQWSPRVNGVPRGRLVGLRGKGVNFYIPGGRYRIVLRGEGISLSARGTGVAQLRARSDARVDTGTYATGDDEPTPLPEMLVRVPFGTGDGNKASP